MNYARLLSDSLTIGEKMLCCGAEVSRVEDSIIRIMQAYGAQRADVFTITSSIVASAEFDGKTYTQTRRIRSYKTDFEMLDGFNALSRKICRELPDEEEIERQTKNILAKKDYAFGVRICSWALTAGAFCVFFGGSFAEGAVSAVIGALLMLCVDFVEKKGINRVFSNLFSSFFVSTLAYFAVWRGVGESSDKIIIGNIMLLIPGLALTNSIRELIDGDIIAGALRFCEACLVAAGIAAGYFLSVYIFGGVM